MEFNENKEVLERMHIAMKERFPLFFSTGLDAGAMRFRRKIENRIET